MDFSKIKSLNNEIKELIAKRPELQEFQDEISARTKDLGSHNRQQVLLTMMVERRSLMLEKFLELSVLSKKAQAFIKEVQ